MSSESSNHNQWFVEEVQPFERPLREYLRRSLPCHADVDDLVQESYIRLFKAKGKGVIRSTKPFLFAIARNAVRDFISRKVDSPQVSFTESTSMPILHDRADFVEIVCREQELAILEDAIRALPNRCRQVIILRKIKGFSQKEIADLLEIAEHTVEALAVQGVRRCAKYLRDRGIGPD